MIKLKNPLMLLALMLVGLVAALSSCTDIPDESPEAVRVSFTTSDRSAGASSSNRQLSRTPYGIYDLTDDSVSVAYVFEKSVFDAEKDLGGSLYEYDLETFISLAYSSGTYTHEFNEEGPTPLRTRAGTAEGLNVPLDTEVIVFVIAWQGAAEASDANMGYMTESFTVTAGETEASVLIEGGAWEFSLPSGGGGSGSTSETLYQLLLVGGKAGDNDSVDEEAAINTRFYGPAGLAADTFNRQYLYVADSYNHTIRMVRYGGQHETYTISGLAGEPGNVLGDTGGQSRLEFPVSVAAAETNLYVAEAGKITKLAIESGVDLYYATDYESTHFGKKVQIIEGVDYIGWDNSTLGDNETLADNRSKDGIGTAAILDDPKGLTFNGGDIDVLYFIDNETIRMVDLNTAEVTTIAGAAGDNGSKDDNGTDARFNGPTDLVFLDNVMYVADTLNHTIRKVVFRDYDENGVFANLEVPKVTTLTGLAGDNGSKDGSLTDARFYRPSGITALRGSLYVADTYNHTIRRIDLENEEVTTIAGAVGDNDTVNDAMGTGVGRLNEPMGIVGVDSGTQEVFLYVSSQKAHTLQRIQWYIQ